MRLTVRNAASMKLPAGKIDHVEFDDSFPGFGVRIREGGSRTWVYRYRVGTKQRSITLGNVASVPLALARKNAGELEAAVRLGRDPAIEKQTARAAAGDTVGALLDQYFDARAGDWRPSSLRQIRWHLLDRAKPLHGLPISAVSPWQIADLLDRVAKTSGTVSSNRVRASLETFFAWCIRRGIRLPDGNVVSATGKRPERSRDRVLSDTELKAIWLACSDDDHGRIVRLLMLTGQRAAEIGSLQWSEVHDERIELPGERTKNKRPHIIPLSDPARAILAGYRMADRDHVFGRLDRGGFRGWGMPKQRLDQLIAEATGSPIAPWVVHDLRRTVATRMAELGIGPHIVEAVLNHVSGHKAGVAGIYNRSTYEKEKRAALTLWAEHVTALVEGRDATVVPLKRA
jgi:integrase